MKKSAFFFAVSLCMLVGAIAPISHVIASGSPDAQLKITNENGAMFVTTESTDSATTTTTTTTGSNDGGDTIAVAQITPPRGFAKDTATLINSLLAVLMSVSALLVFGFLIWGGVQWITSGGDKTKVDAARQKIIAAVVGLLIIASSYAILTLVIRFLGFTDLNDVLNNIHPINQSSSSTTTTTSSTTLRQQNLVQ
jgi:hypothetical protein